MEILENEFFKLLKVIFGPIIQEVYSILIEMKVPMLLLLIVIAFIALRWAGRIARRCIVIGALLVGLLLLLL